MATGDLLSLSNPVFSAYAFYSAILVVKMLLMALLTTRQRFAKKAYANPEDVAMKDKTLKPVTGDPDVERVRRCHLNDLENIPAFLFAGLVFVLVGPTPQVALWHFRVFTAARLLHTVVYLSALQPYRVYTFLAGFITTLSIAGQIIAATL